MATSVQNFGGDVENAGSPFVEWGERVASRAS